MSSKKYGIVIEINKIIFSRGGGGLDISIWIYDLTIKKARSRFEKPKLAQMYREGLSRLARAFEDIVCGKRPSESIE